MVLHRAAGAACLLRLLPPCLSATNAGGVRATMKAFQRIVRRLSLKTRINVLVTGLLALFAAGVGLLAIQDARNSVREEMEAATKVTQHLLRFVVLRELSRTHDWPRDGLVEMARGLGRIRAQELLVRDRTGEMLYRSPASSYKKGQHAPDWFARRLTPPVEVLQVPVGDLVLEVRPDPSRAVLDAWDDLVLLFWVMAALLALLNLLLYRVVGNAFGKVQGIVGAMEAMGRGRLDVRVPGLGVPELDRLQQAFNAMATTLERSRAENRQLNEDQALARLVQARLDEERRAIARELHDELGQCVTAIRAIALSIASRTAAEMPEVQGSALSIASVAGSMYDAVHAIVARLRPAALARLGLADGLREWLCGWQACHPGRQVDLSVAPGLPNVPAAVELAVLRTVQEALSNAVRHGEARCMRVRLEHADGVLLVGVEDDGCGFAVMHVHEGKFGLAGMRERACALGGRVEIASAAGRGTSVRGFFPLDAEAVDCASSGTERAT